MLGNIPAENSRRVRIDGEAYTGGIEEEVFTLPSTWKGKNVISYYEDHQGLKTVYDDFSEELPFYRNYDLIPVYEETISGGSSGGGSCTVNVTGIAREKIYIGGITITSTGTYEVTSGAVVRVPDYFYEDGSKPQTWLYCDGVLVSKFSSGPQMIGVAVDGMTINCSSVGSVYITYL